MSRSPAYFRDISVKLASVLEDIGVNEHTVQISRRRLVLLKENLSNFKPELIFKTYYFFGSQSEGTTTIGLESDYDNFLSCDNYAVLQDMREWDPALINLVMFQDESTPPGYCMLERPDRIHGHDMSPDPVEPFATHFGDIILVENALLRLQKGDDFSDHGAAFSFLNTNIEIVYAIPFKSLPNFVSHWLKQQLQKGRITQNMKKYIECHPCYLVPAGCKGSANEEFEWRISTCHAERCVMFNLNITQIQCYVMLKLMLKTHLKHPSEQGLSSYMCKNIILLCIDDTVSDDWCSDNLLPLFKLCLLQLEHCVSEEYCPHFIMHENNLMAGRFKPEVKLWLLNKIQELYKNSVCYFLCLATDNVGRRLETKLEISTCNFDFENPEAVSMHIFGLNLHNIAYVLPSVHNSLLNAIVSGKTTFNSIILNAIEFYHQGDSIMQAAILLLTPLIYSSLGSVKASSDIKQGQPVSPEALVWLFLGLNSDVTSGRLKLASVYYCTGDYSKAEAILTILEDNYNTSMVNAMCDCMNRSGNGEVPTLVEQEYLIGEDEQAIRHDFAFGIKFLRSEINCAPKELQYEMFRTTQEDFALHRRNKGKANYWMDWAVVDSRPYMYFLQYKVYGYLQRPADQNQALIKFAWSIYTTSNLRHAETALNLLGQCYEQENKNKEAFYCYRLSLKTCLRNNAASIHMCRLLNSLISAM